MEEIYELFSENLHEELKKKINAGIFCKVYGEDLRCRIINDGIVWE